MIHILVARRTARISSVLKKFGDGDRSARLQVERNDEISELSHSINWLLAEIEEDEKEIRDGHERLHALFDNVIESVIVINEKGTIESANPATEKIFGYTPEELMGCNVSMLMPEFVSHEHDSYLASFCESDVARTVGAGRQVEARHKSGNCFPAELAISEMHVHGERLFTGILRDISEQVEMRRKMQQAYEELHEAHARLEESARTDKLTSLFNRGHFDTTLLGEILRATRHGLPMSLMLLDVDYFKPYNDYYGHLAGDHCLKELAQTLKQTFLRSGEVVARYGGEEFAVILPHCNKQDAMNRANRLLSSVRERAIPHEKSGVADHITVSIGVITHIPRAKQPADPDDLIKAADEMLYNAKAAGRNQSCHCDFSLPTDVSPAKVKTLSSRH
jgi:diguanylate cyclase (GGDEF)-like protein/PAS domain S-box-containing protein